MQLHRQVSKMLTAKVLESDHPFVVDLVHEAGLG